MPSSSAKPAMTETKITQWAERKCYREIAVIAVDPSTTDKHGLESVGLLTSGQQFEPKPVTVVEVVVKCGAF